MSESAVPVQHVHRRAVASRRAFFALLAAAGAGALTACAGTESGRAIASGSAESGDAVGGMQELRGSGARVAPAAAGVVRQRLAAFSSALVAATEPDAKGNILVSPYSLLAALGMADLGAAGAPADVLRKGLGGSAEEVASWITAVDAAVADAVAESQDVESGGNKLDPMVVQTANSLFLQQDYRLRQEFLDAVARGYDAPVRTVDYRGDADGARKSINTWVAERTNDLIPELLAPDMVTTITRLVLVNALYLKAPWSAGPAADSTHDFTTGSGERRSVPWLAMDASTTPYATGDGWSAASIGLGGGGLAMTVVLPETAGTDPVTLLTPEVLQAATAGEDTKVKVQLPQLDLDFATDMVRALSAMGMGGAFKVPLTDLPEPGQEPVLIEAIIQKVTFTTDKDGIEAAAATAVVAPGGAAPGAPDEPIEFVVDRPFLFVLHDNTTGAPLFAGVVADPG